MYFSSSFPLAGERRRRKEREKKKINDWIVIIIRDPAHTSSLPSGKRFIERRQPVRRLTQQRAKESYIHKFSSSVCCVLRPTLRWAWFFFSFLLFVSSGEERKILHYALRHLIKWLSHCECETAFGILKEFFFLQSKKKMDKKLEVLTVRDPTGRLFFHAYFFFFFLLLSS